MLRNLIKNEKGSMTVFLALILLAMVAFIGLFIDLGRIKVAQNQMARIANASARSVLADYNTSLKEDFAIFSLDGSKSASYNEDFNKYVKANLAPSEGEDFKLLDLQLEQDKTNLSLVELSSLKMSGPDNNIDKYLNLRKQILEDTKYTTPIENGKFIKDLFVLKDLFSFLGQSDEKRKHVQKISENIEDIDKVFKEDIKKLSQERDEVKNQLDKEKKKLVELPENASQDERDAINERIDEFRAKLSEYKDDINNKLGDSENLYKTNKELQAEINKLEVEQSGGDQVVSDTVKGAQERDKEYYEKVFKNNDDILGEIESNKNLLSSAGEDQLLGDNIKSDTASAVVNENEKNKKKAVNGSEVSFDKKTDDESVNKLIDDAKDSKEYSINNSVGLFDFGIITNVLKKLGDIVLIPVKILNNLTDDGLYINEYILSHLSYIGESKGDDTYPFTDSEIEYIIYGENPKARAVADLWFMRYIMDLAAYYAFTTLPAGPLERFIYSAIMAGATATTDTFILLGKLSVGNLDLQINQGSVKIANTWKTPFTIKNPIKSEWSYQDHLRVNLFLETNDDQKLERISEIIKSRSGYDPANQYTIVGGNVTVSMKMWFLPLIGIRNIEDGPFGTEIRDGRCVITQNVQYGY